MSRRIGKALQSKLFPSPLVEGKYPVIPPLVVPPHIAKPEYVTAANPIFGKYEGKPHVHNSESIAKMKRVAKIASKTLGDTQKFILDKSNSNQPLTEEDIDKYLYGIVQVLDCGTINRFVFNSIVEQNAYPTPIGFMHFPKSVCTSVNECIVHGIPSMRVLQAGDKINIDVTAYLDGYHGDNNLTVMYGAEREGGMHAHMIAIARQAVERAIKVCGPGVKYNEIGKTIELFAKEKGVHVCRDFAGHGIGHLLHMPPQVLHYYNPQMREVMEVGHIFTIQPILTYRQYSYLQVWADGFTCISRNNPNAQFQHTVLITQNGVQVLTRRQSEVY